MKQSLIILLISVCAANAQMWTNFETGAVAPQPERRPADAVNVSEEWFILPGWQPFDLAQQAAWDAAEAVAQAEAEEQQAAQASLPFMNASGFAAINAAGHWVKFVPADTNEVTEAIAVQISHSPPDPKTAKLMEDEFKAKRAAERYAAKAALEDTAKNGKVNDRLAAIEAALKTLLK